MSLDTSDPKMSLHADPDKIEETPIKVAWLKQQKAEEEGTLPLLDFDEQQYFTFDRRHTTFRMVKHSCSYPAPPHKVRMWCSSLGASPNLPSTMDLNTFINTFELITEEKHTLEMAHLTGGETIAFEMVQEQASELSTFLLGAQPPNTQLSLKPPAAALRPSVPRQADEDPALSGSSLEPPGTARLENLSEQKKAAEAHRRKLADELVKEEEEEARRREKAKAKKRAKKEKQKEKKKAQGAGATVGDDDDDDDDDGKAEGGAGAVVGAGVAESSLSGGGGSGGRGGGSGGGGVCACSGGGGAAASGKLGHRAPMTAPKASADEEDAENAKLNGRPRPASSIDETRPRPAADGASLEGGHAHYSAHATPAARDGARENGRDPGKASVHTKGPVATAKGAVVGAAAAKGPPGGAVASAEGAVATAKGAVVGAAAAKGSPGGAVASAEGAADSNDRWRAGSGAVASADSLEASGARAGRQGLDRLIAAGLATTAPEDSELRAVWDALPECAARRLSDLELEIERSHELIRALVLRCMLERDAKEAAIKAKEAALLEVKLARSEPAAQNGAGTPKICAL